MAAVSPESYELAGQKGMHILASPQITPIPMVRDCYERYGKALAEAGFDPAEFAVPQSRQVYCHADAERAREDPRDSVMWYQRLNAERMSSKSGSAKSYELYARAQERLSRTEYEEYLSSGALLARTPSGLIDEIAHLRDEIGLNYLLCVTDFVGLDTDTTIKSLKLFAEEVIPILNESEHMVSTR